MTQQPLKPGGWYYGLAVFVFIIGMAGFGLFLLKSITGLTDSLLQVVVPGETELRLSQVGQYTIFHEYQSVVDGRSYSGGDLAGLQCTLTAQDTGRRIELSAPAGRSTYAIGKREGESFLTFRIEQPGRYLFSVRYAEQPHGSAFVLAIGHGFTQKLIGLIFSALGIFLGTIALASAIVVITSIKREKAKRQLEGQR